MTKLTKEQPTKLSLVLAIESRTGVLRKSDSRVSMSEINGSPRSSAKAGTHLQHYALCPSSTARSLAYPERLTGNRDPSERIAM